jgi:hypothetical protein
LGGAAQGLAERISSYPRLVLAYPELLVLAAAAGAACLETRAQRREVYDVYRWPLALSGCLLSGLIIGQIRDGAPTHHAERSLLPIWLLCALFAADAAERARRVGFSKRAPLRAGLLLLAGILVFRATRFHDQGFVDRSAEIDIGTQARRILATKSAPSTEAQATYSNRGASTPLLIDTADFGYFAVIAAFGEPEQSAPFTDHDPRHPRSADPFESSVTLVKALDAHGARWFIAPRERARAVSSGALRAYNGKFGLFERL